MYGSSYHDQIDPFRDQSRPPSTDPFSSRPPTRPASSTASSAQQSQVNRYFHSRRIKKEDAQKPWLEKKDPKEKWVTIIPLIGLAIGFTIAGLLVYDGIRSVVHHNYCPILSDDFSRGLDPMIWTKEAEVGGFGSVHCSTHSSTTYADTTSEMDSSKRQPSPTKTSMSRMESL